MCGLQGHTPLRRRCCRFRASARVCTLQPSHAVHPGWHVLAPRNSSAGRSARHAQRESRRRGRLSAVQWDPAIEALTTERSLLINKEVGLLLCCLEWSHALMKTSQRPSHPAAAAAVPYCVLPVFPAPSRPHPRCCCSTHSSKEGGAADRVQSCITPVPLHFSIHRWCCSCSSWRWTASCSARSPTRTLTPRARCGRERQGCACGAIWLLDCICRPLAAEAAQAHGSLGKPEALCNSAPVVCARHAGARAAAAGGQCAAGAAGDQGARVWRACGGALRRRGVCAADHDAQGTGGHSSVEPWLLW